MRNQLSVQVVCAEYEGLLKESQIALNSWANERAEISSHRGRDLYNELRTLQGDFLRAWALLQDHKRDCEVCQVVSMFERVYAGTDEDTVICQTESFYRGDARGQAS